MVVLTLIENFFVYLYDKINGIYDAVSLQFRNYLTSLFKRNMSSVARMVVV